MPNVFSPRLEIYHDDLAPVELPQDVRRGLIEAVQATDTQELSVLKALRTRSPTP